MRGPQLLLLFAGLILTACEDADDANALRNALTMTEIKLSLANHSHDNILIKRVDAFNEIYTIHFESGDSIAVQARWINAIVYDSLNWLATFQFHDGTEQKANFVGTLDIDESDVVPNPHSTAPLTAFAAVKTPVKGKFKVSVKGKQTNGITIENIFDNFSDDHELPILGLYENYLNQIEFVFMNEGLKPRTSKTVVLQTPLIQNRPSLEIEVLHNRLPEKYSGLYVISNLRTGIDPQGETRWYYGEEGMFFAKLMNGNFIVSGSSNLNFYEVTMLGQRMKEYHVPNGLHHEIFEMPGGNFLVASHSPPGAPFEDVVVEISRTSGRVIKSWDFKTILDPLRKPLPNTQPGDWLHINALYYDPADNSIVISGRSQCAVVKIDYATGAIQWILGNHNYWTESFSPFLLKPVNSQGDPIDVAGTDFWMYGQHAIHRLQDGNLLLYDNGDYRGFYDNPDAPQNSYTRLVEYKINQERMTAELVWHFNHNREVFTKFTGYTQDLDDTRLAAYMFASENTPKIVEVNKNNEVVYEATLNRGSASYYRTMKLDVYSGID